MTDVVSDVIWPTSTHVPNRERPSSFLGPNELQARAHDTKAANSRLIRSLFIVDVLWRVWRDD